MVVLEAMKMEQPLSAHKAGVVTGLSAEVGATVAGRHSPLRHQGRLSRAVSSLDLLSAAYRPLIAFAGQLDEEQGWTATHLPGWTVRDLVFHLAGDAQRGLVALATPHHGPADTDEVSYWSEWRPGTEGAKAGLRWARVSASAWTSVRGPADLFVETATAVLTAARRSTDEEVVTTQGRHLTVRSLLHTLSVEAAVHQLDLEPALPDPPEDGVLAEVRHVLDGLLGAPAEVGWSDLRYVRVGTGRLPMLDVERDRLGPLASRFPLFG